MGFISDPYVSAGIGFAVGIFLGFALRGRMRSLLLIQSHIPRAILAKQRLSTSTVSNSSTGQTSDDTAQVRAERAINRSFGGLELNNKCTPGEPPPPAFRPKISVFLRNRAG